MHLLSVIITIIINTIIIINIIIAKSHKVKYSSHKFVFLWQNVRHCIC